LFLGGGPPEIDPLQGIRTMSPPLWLCSVIFGSNAGQTIEKSANLEQHGSTFTALELPSTFQGNHNVQGI
jgi:hypothetical protein